MLKYTLSILVISLLAVGCWVERPAGDAHTIPKISELDVDVGGAANASGESKAQADPVIPLGGAEPPATVGGADSPSTADPADPADLSTSEEEASEDTPSADSTAGGCQDIPPNDKHSCADQAKWGKCLRPWMLAGKFCAKSCGRCLL